MNRAFIIPLLIISLLVSCKPGIEKTIKKKGIIPEKEFIEILTEFSIADGIINEPSLVNSLHFNDSDKYPYAGACKQGFYKRAARPYP